ncbi:hypothetical protein DY119_04235 [Apilactobacillus micheneri]|nr:hypothetical protein DY119_04235 [Apilactobacillus micheneri]
MKILWQNFLTRTIGIIFFLIIQAAWQTSFMVLLIVSVILIVLFLILFKLFPNFDFWTTDNDSRMLYKHHKVLIPICIIIFYIIFAFISIKFWNLNSILYLFIVFSVTNFIYSLKKE